VNLRVPIAVSEWITVYELLGVVNHDERSWDGQVRLRSDGRCRRWLGSRSGQYVMLTGGVDTQVYDIGISPAVLRGVFRAAGGGETMDLVASTFDSGATLVGLEGPGGRIAAEVLDIHQQYPDLDRTLLAETDFAARGTIGVRQLLDMIRTIGWVRQSPRDDDGSEAHTWHELDIIDGDLRLEAESPECGTLILEAELDGASGQASRRIDLSSMIKVLEVFDGDADVEVGIPADPTGPIHLMSGDWHGAVTTVRSDASILRDRVERVIEECFGSLAVLRDDDGDYPLVRDRGPVFARLRDDAHTVLQVFARLLDDVPATAELYRELNDLNRNVGHARLFHVDDQVLAEVDLVATTLDGPELEVAVERILDVAAGMAPALQAFFGGRPVSDPAAQRWARNRTAVFNAEIVPGAMVELNGTDAVQQWPFPGVVHVLTSWNPQGASIGSERQDSVNIAIAEDILRHGGRFVWGERHTEGGDGAEECLIAWGLSRDEAVKMGRRASQESVFELDGNQVRLVSCSDQRVEAWPRRT